MNYSIQEFDLNDAVPLEIIGSEETIDYSVLRKELKQALVLEDGKPFALIFDGIFHQIPPFIEEPTRYYITDTDGRRMRDSRGKLFEEKSVEDAENVIYWYFDKDYGKRFGIFALPGGELVKWVKEESETA